MKKLKQEGVYLAAQYVRQAHNLKVLGSNPLPRNQNFTLH